MKQPKLPSPGAYASALIYIVVCIVAGAPIFKLMNYLSSLGPFWAEFVGNGVIGGMFFMGGACVAAMVVVLSIWCAIYWVMYLGIYKWGIYKWCICKWDIYKRRIYRRLIYRRRRIH